MIFHKAHLNLVFFGFIPVKAGLKAHIQRLYWGELPSIDVVYTYIHIY